MEFSDPVASEQVLPHREGTEKRPLKEFSHVKRNKIDLEMCRFCLKKPPEMLNIFDSPSDLFLPIAEMISLVTGHNVCKGDPFPKKICRPCLEDATKALKLKKTYQRSHEFFCKLREDSRTANNLLEKLSETQRVVVNRVKTERVEDDLLKKEKPYSESVKADPQNDLDTRFEEHEELDQCTVRNEPIEQDSSEKDHQSYDGEVNRFAGEVKRKETQDQYDSQAKIGGSQRNKCFHCSKNFKRPSQLKVHIQFHTEERPYKCFQCLSAFKTLHCLKRHVETHTSKIKLKCDLCEKTFANERSLKMHRFNCSKSLALLEKVRSRPYKCLECPKSFSAESDLTEHSLIHSGEMAYAYVCSICDRTFLQQISLQRHLRWHKDKRTFKCSQCPKSFLDEQQLNKHILTHQGINSFKERPYKCSQCEKSFAFSNHLKLHTLAHSGKSPYQCPHCPMSFFGKLLLEDHIRTHTGERPYKCDICQKTFTCKANLRNHIFTHRNKS